MIGPPEPWALVEPEFDVRRNVLVEALCTLGSGPLQQRGTLEEGLADDPQDAEFLYIPGRPVTGPSPAFRSRAGTFLSAVAGPHPTCGEHAINLPAIHGLVLFVGHERLDLERCRIREYERRLDLRTGHLHRRFLWDTRAGATLAVRFERLVSARRRHVMLLRCEIRHVAGPAAEVRMLGPLSAEVHTNGIDCFTSVDITGEHEPITLTVRTNGEAEVGAAAVLTSDQEIYWAVDVEDRWVALRGSRTLKPGEALRVDKFAALTSDRHVRVAPTDAARTLAWEAAAAGFERLAAESDEVWQARWERSDVEIDGDPAAQHALRVALYHLLRALPEDDPRVGLDPALGTSETVGGRYQWETDILALPAYLYTRPAAARSLARFRTNTLAGARRNALRQDYPGARYAWQSAADGQEQCLRRHEADHAVHVTADVAYAVYHAQLANPHDTQLLAAATELLIETARYWAARGTPRPEQDAVEFLTVTGPDRYTPFCRNNAYTNRLAAFNLVLAQHAYQKLARVAPEQAEAVARRCAATPDELATLAEIATKVHLPYDAENGCILHADDFFAREPFELDAHWTNRARPLIDCVSRERLYRGQVLEQADALLLIALFPQEFDFAQLRAAFDTYAPLTAHDAPASLAIHALLAAWLERGEAALDYFRRACDAFLTPVIADDGLDGALAGALWQAAVLGFGGVRTRVQSDMLWLEPHLPAGWQALRFAFVWDEQPLRIRITPTKITISHSGARELKAMIAGELRTISAGRETVFAVAAGTA